MQLMANLQAAHSSGMSKQLIVNGQLYKFPPVVKPQPPGDSPYLCVHRVPALVQLVGYLIDGVTLHVEFHHLFLRLAENGLAVRPADDILVRAYPAQRATDFFEVEETFLHVELLKVVRSHVAADEPVDDIEVHNPLVEVEILERFPQPFVCFREHSNDFIPYQLDDVIVFSGEHPAFVPLPEPYVAVSPDKKLYIFHNPSFMTLVIASVSSCFILLLAFNFATMVE